MQRSSKKQGKKKEVFKWGLPHKYIIQVTTIQFSSKLLSGKCVTSKLCDDENLSVDYNISKRLL